MRHLACVEVPTQACASPPASASAPLFLDATPRRRDTSNTDASRQLLHGATPPSLRRTGTAPTGNRMAGDLSHRLEAQTPASASTAFLWPTPSRGIVLESPYALQKTTSQMPISQIKMQAARQLTTTLRSMVLRQAAFPFRQLCVSGPRSPQQVGRCTVLENECKVMQQQIAEMSLGLRSHPRQFENQSNLFHEVVRLQQAWAETSSDGVWATPPPESTSPRTLCPSPCQSDVSSSTVRAAPAKDEVSNRRQSEQTRGGQVTQFAAWPPETVQSSHGSMLLCRQAATAFEQEQLKSYGDGEQRHMSLDPQPHLTRIVSSTCHVSQEIASSDVTVTQCSGPKSRNIYAGASQLPPSREVLGHSRSASLPRRNKPPCFALEPGPRHFDSVRVAQRAPRTTRFDADALVAEAVQAAKNAQEAGAVAVPAPQRQAPKRRLTMNPGNGDAAAGRCRAGSPLPAPEPRRRTTVAPSDGAGPVRAAGTADAGLVSALASAGSARASEARLRAPRSEAEATLKAPPAVSADDSDLE